MFHYKSTDLEKLPSRYRANLINSCTGYKSVNLLATKSNQGNTNLAIFNSVVHIGSNPAMLGFISRPLTVPRHTYRNIREHNLFTVNQVNKHIFEKAHHTSAKYDEKISEFDKTNLTEEYLDDFDAPYVKESAIKLGCEYVSEYKIEENGCLLIIGAIKHIYLNSDIVAEDGWVKLDDVDTMSSVGLDGYALPKIIDRLSYAKPDENINSLWNES
ncbi:flavin reductase family protein [Zobellia uliginosa]|uniref:flavin reductase family protein n=1 Tax=Zobellia uliginosa TaxID=143224 RepID=UPI001C077851|nr:flavin reductase [Zobellia uliginosa]MBU2947226.1 flavin reductase family protein [Zobellia uliginosa]